MYVPVLHGMRTDDPSYLLGVEAATGKTLFRVERPTDARSESPDAYTTPVVLRKGTAVEIVVTGGDIVTGHDPKTGKELWRANGLNPTAILTTDRRLAFVLRANVVPRHASAHAAPARVRPLRRDEVRLAVAFDQGLTCGPGHGGTLLYVVNDKGLLWCLDLVTGTPHYGPPRLLAHLQRSRSWPTSSSRHERGRPPCGQAGTTFELLAEHRWTTHAAPLRRRGAVVLDEGICMRSARVAR